MKNLLFKLEKKSILLLILFTATIGYGQNRTQTFTSSSTFTVPAGVTQLTIEAWGGGGKGGTRTNNNSAGGGGGGAYAKKVVTVIPGNTYTVNVGIGSTSTTTTTDSDSWFNNNTTILAKGGSSVANNSSTGASGGSSVNSIGDVVRKGGRGSNGSSGNFGGGGGSSAGQSAIGNDTANSNGATAPTGGGKGGNGATSNADAQNAGSTNGAVSPGGGGGGARKDSGTTKYGGSGANGQIIISWDEPEINLTGNAVSIVDGDSTPSTSDWTDMGSTDTNAGSTTRTFTIENNGTKDLSIGTITIGGANAADFTVSTSPSSTVAPGNSTTFVVTFNPSATGTRIATLNLINDDTDENPYDFTLQGLGIIDIDGDGLDVSVDTDDDNDGINDIVECSTCITDPFVNGSFENPIISASSYSILPTSSVTGWQTSAENFIEIWSSGFNGVPSASGNQFAELNANVPGTLYQTFCLNGAGGTINWSIKHRGRSGIDQAFVKFGPNLSAALASTPIVEMVDGDTAWGTYSGVYSIPTGQSQIVLTFQAGYTASGSQSVGNFIDDIQITINQNCLDTDRDGIPNINDLDSDNDGISDIEEAGFKAYSNNTSTMDKSNSSNWVDANANGMNDYIDSMIVAGTYTIANTDGDGSRNHLDLDSDNDSLFDVDEAGLSNGDGDINGDGKGDGSDTDTDGILNLYDNSTSFGTIARAYAQDTDSNGTPDFLQLDSDNDDTKDIQTGLYSSLDTNNDGKIDGSTDADRDGILDGFDTNTSTFGSPRDLNRKLLLDFDGRNDYAEATGVLGGLSNATLMAWVDLGAGYNSDGVVVGQDRFQIRISSAKKFEVYINGITVTYNSALNTSQWYHMAATYGGGSLKLYLKLLNNYSNN